MVRWCRSVVGIGTYEEIYLAARPLTLPSPLSATPTDHVTVYVCSDLSTLFIGDLVVRCPVFTVWVLSTILTVIWVYF